MSILREINNYCTDATAYWYNEIDNSSYVNKDELKSNIDTFMQELKDAYVTYKNSLDRTALSSLIMALFAYSVHKDGVTFDDPNIPPVEDIQLYIPDLYHNWNYTIPDYTQLFELIANESDATLGEFKTSPDTLPPVDQRLTTPPIFDALKNAIENEFAPYDNKFVPNQSKLVSSASVDRAMYRIFKNPQPKPNSVNIKEIINTSYGLQEIKDEFNWSWPGLDD